MRKKSFLIFLILLIGFTQAVFAGTAYYSFDNDNIELSVPDSDWLSAESGNREVLKGQIDDNKYSLVCEMFDNDSRVKMVALSPDDESYWAMAAIGNGTPPAELDYYSDEEWRKFRLADLSDEEIIEMFSDAVSSSKIDVSFTDVYQTSETKYLVTAGMIDANGYRAAIYQYLTIVNGYTYTFNFYPMTDDHDLALNALERFHSVLNNIKYQSVPMAEGKDSEEVVENEPPKYNIKTFYIIGVIAVIACILELVVLKKKKPKADNVSRTAIYTEQTGNVPSEDLRALKTLYDQGIITEEEYKEKKKKLLGL